MKNILFVNCSIRSDAESRTTTLAKAFLNDLNANYKVTELSLKDMGLKPLIGDYFEERQALLDKRDLSHPRFDLAHQFQNADMIVVAAPFWDLSFPSLLKIYIENISVDGITFGTSETGLKGLCKASDLIYLTTRGGIYQDDPMEMALPHMEALCKFFGIDHFHAIAADGMDIVGYDAVTSLKEACKQASLLAKSL